jgi:hypothetical protein
MAKDTDIVLDPIQGFDVGVYAQVSPTLAGGGTPDAVLVGTFTSVMFKVVNQTETYLPLNQRIARHLDGELLFVWAAEQGFIHPGFLANTFGSNFAGDLSGTGSLTTNADPSNPTVNYRGGRASKIRRTQRFSLIFQVDMSSDVTSQNEASFWNDNFTDDGQKLELKMCRVDTYTFGVTPGRNIVANSWQGTAEMLSLLKPAV